MLPFMPLLAFAGLLATMLFRTALLRRSGIRAVTDIHDAPLGEKLVKKASMVVWWAFALAVLIFAIDAQPAWLPAALTYKLFDIYALQIVGAILCILGAVMYPLAQADMGKVWRIGIDRAVGQGADGKSDLVTGGLFSMSRNPIYIMIDSVFIGAFLVHGNLTILVLAAAYIKVSHREILDEERFLQERFGDQYSAYRRRVGRYLLGL